MSPASGRKGNLSTEVLRRIVDQATRPPQGHPMDLPLDGSRVGSLQGDRAAGLE